MTERLVETYFSTDRDGQCVMVCVYEDEHHDQRVVTVPVEDCECQST